LASPKTSNRPCDACERLAPQPVLQRPDAVAIDFRGVPKRPHKASVEP
jgi:hypothetical protein